jgi:hypothetical protein
VRRRRPRTLRRSFGSKGRQGLRSQVGSRHTPAARFARSITPFLHTTQQNRPHSPSCRDLVTSFCPLQQIQYVRLGVGERVRCRSWEHCRCRRLAPRQLRQRCRGHCEWGMWRGALPSKVPRRRAGLRRAARRSRRQMAVPRSRTSATRRGSVLGCGCEPWHDA